MKKSVWKRSAKRSAGFLLCIFILLLSLQAAAAPEAAYIMEETPFTEPVPDQEISFSEPVPEQEASFSEQPALEQETTGEEEAPVYEAGLPRIAYKTHIQTYGWLDWVGDGAESGTTNQGKRLEAIQIRLSTALSGSVEYRTHVQTYGWLDWVRDGAESGTTNQGKRLEAIQIRLTGEMEKQYDIYYRVHCQTFDWTGWAKNGAPAGSIGYAKRLEAIQLCLVPKGQPAPGDTDSPYYENLKVTYQTHVQTYGWQKGSSNGQTNGTTGKAKRLEGIRIRLENHTLTEGGIEYRTHVQTYGWQDWVGEGTISGTTGKAKRLEAIEIRLTGEMEKQYDIYYRVHCQTFGWTGWAKNGAPAGSEGYSKRLEAIEICLAAKGSAAPGPVNRTYFNKADSIKITQYGNRSGGQLMCYTLEDQKGNLAIIDGGYEKDAALLRRIIQSHGGHVSAWILTHPHPDHIGAINAILSAPKDIQIDQIYAVPVSYDRYRETAQPSDMFETYETFLKVTKNMKNIHYVSENEEFDLLGLDFKVLHAWDETTDELDTALCNNGSMVFVLKGKQEKMLFLSDMENETEGYILERHQDELNADYVQAAHHGNWGASLDFYHALSPRRVFMDAPGWLLRENTIYDAHVLKTFFEKKGITVTTFSTAPNVFSIH